MYKGQEVAIKTCRENLSEESKKKFLQEGRILMQYNHRNIVKFIGIAAHRHPVMIVMEYVPGKGNFQDNIRTPVIHVLLCMLCNTSQETRSNL